MNKQTTSRMMVVGSMLVFGTIGLFRRSIPLPSSVIAVVRGLIGTLFLLGVMLVRHQHFDRAALKKKLPLLVLSGGLIGVNWILLFEAYNYTTIPVATLCYYMAPIFVMLASPIVLRERLTLRKGLCSAAALLGMAMVAGIDFGAILGHPASGLATATDLATGTDLGAPAGPLNNTLGILLGLGAAVCYATVMLMNQRLTAVPTYDRTVMQLGCAAVLLLPYVLLTESFAAMTFSAPTVGLLLVVGIIHTGLAYYLYFGGMAHMSAQSVAICSYIDPVASILLAWAILGESMNVRGWIGSVLILGAAIICELPSRKQAD